MIVPFQPIIPGTTYGQHNAQPDPDADADRRSREQRRLDAFAPFVRRMSEDVPATFPFEEVTRP